jgi:hypothetical protein
MWRFLHGFGVLILVSCAPAASESPATVPSAIAELGPSVLQDTSFVRELRRLIRTSPVLRPSRDLVTDQRFVREVRTLLLSARADSSAVAAIDSAEEAMAALEAISAQHTAAIHVYSPTNGFRVGMRRLSYRGSRTIPWIPLRTDTTVYKEAVAYQFRYRPRPDARRDTIITVPCADDCDVLVP